MILISSYFWAWSGRFLGGITREGMGDQSSLTPYKGGTLEDCQREETIRILQSLEGRSGTRLMRRELLETSKLEI